MIDTNSSQFNTYAKVWNKLEQALEERKGLDKKINSLQDHLRSLFGLAVGVE